MNGARKRTPSTHSAFGSDPSGQPAPPWTTREWFGIGHTGQLTDLRGEVVVSPCVHHVLPQAQRIHATLAATDVAVIGLHTGFEQHAAITPASPQAFPHEYCIRFPAGMDAKLLVRL